MRNYHRGGKASPSADMSSQQGRKIKTVEELTAEENERLRSFREMDFGPVKPLKLKEMHVGRMVIICGLFALITIPVSLANHYSLTISILLFFGVFVVLLLLLLTMAVLGPYTRLP